MNESRGNGRGEVEREKVARGGATEEPLSSLVLRGEEEKGRMGERRGMVVEGVE